LAIDHPLYGKSATEPDAGAPAPESDVTRSDADAEAQSDGFDSLSVFPSEMEGTGPGVADAWIYDEDVYATARSLTAPLVETRSESAAASDPHAQDTADLLRNQEVELDALTGLQHLCRGMVERLVQTEQSLRRAEDLAADRSTRSDEILIRTENALGTVQSSVAQIDKTLHELCVTIGKRSAATEEMLRRVDEFVADRTLQQLAARIDARLADTTAEVHQIERLLRGDGFREFSARIDSRLLRTEEAVRRIERMLEATAARQIDRMDGDRPSGKRRMGLHAHWAWTGLTNVVRSGQDRATYLWNQVTRRIDASRMAARAAGALLLLVVLSLATVRLDDLIGLHGSSGSSAARPAPPVESVIVPAVEAALLTAASTTPPAVRQAEPATSVVAAVVARPRPARRQSASQGRAREETEAVQTASSSQYFGTLEIASTPPGASVFVNGRAVGVTPLTLTRQRAGSLAVQITREGFNRWSSAVLVRSGSSTEVNATLLPEGP
jgi:uncharacterized protein YcbK (DUF882 family)